MVVFHRIYIFALLYRIYMYVLVLQDFCVGDVLRDLCDLGSHKIYMLCCFRGCTCGVVYRIYLCSSTDYIWCVVYRIFVLSCSMLSTWSIFVVLQIYELRCSTQFACCLILNDLGNVLFIWSASVILQDIRVVLSRWYAVLSTWYTW